MTMDSKKVTVNTYQYGLAEIVVTRPVLDEKERAKVEARIKRALESFGKEMAKKGVL